MRELGQILPSLEEMTYARSAPIRTSLFDLIEVISEEVEPGEENLIVATLAWMFNSERFRIRGNGDNFLALLDDGGEASGFI